MAVKKPLVLGADGRVQQLQAGDSLSIVSETGVLTQTADATLIAGAIVYASAADHVNKAMANALSTAIALGVAQTAITSAGTGVIQYNGIVTLSTAQWDAVAGTTGGLAFNTTYYLSPTTASFWTSTCPTAVGQFVVIMGVALSTTEMMLRVDEPTLL